MGAVQSKPAAPDRVAGIPVDDMTDGRMLLGHVGEESVLLARSGDRCWVFRADA
jgi:hypothetical protein